MVKVLNCDIVVSEFEIQLCYYVPFQTNILRKDTEIPYPPTSNELNSTTAVLP